METAGKHITKKLITVEHSESIEQGLMIMKNHHFRHLPVINNSTKEIVGIVSDRDLYKGLSMDETEVNKVMSHPVYRFEVTSSLKEIVDAMIKNKISAFLLTQNSEVRGIITSEDMLVILSNSLKSDNLQKSFGDNYLEYTNQMTGAQFNPNLIF